MDITQSYGSKVDDLIFEWSGFDTTSSQSRRKQKRDTCDSWRRNEQSSVRRNVFSVPSQAPLVTVEDWRVLWCGCILWPVPVWCISFVAAFLSERLLVDPQEPTMPSKEVTGVLDGKSF